MSQLAHHLPLIISECWLVMDKLYNERVSEEVLLETALRDQNIKAGGPGRELDFHITRKEKTGNGISNE